MSSPDSPTITVRIAQTIPDHPSSPWEMRLWLEAPESEGGGVIEFVEFDRRGDFDHRFATRNAALKRAAKETKRLMRVGRRWTKNRPDEKLGTCEYKTEVTP